MFNAQLNLVLCSVELSMKVKGYARIRNRYNQVPQQTQDTIWDSDKTIGKHHSQ